jgi:hypothetical protein
MLTCSSTVVSWNSRVEELTAFAAVRNALLGPLAVTNCLTAAAPAGQALKSAVPTTAWADTLPRLQASGWSTGAHPPAGHSRRKRSCRENHSMMVR